MIFSNDTEIYYEDSIEGSRTVVMLHGNGEDHSIFLNHREYFIKLNYRVILVDTRYHGRSGRGEKPLDFFTFAEDVKALMKYLDIAKADFIGFSDGANTLIHLCMIAGRMVEGCVLISPNIFPKGLKNLGHIKTQERFARFLGFTNKEKRKQAEIMGLMTRNPNLNFEQLKIIKNKVLILSGTNDVIKKKHIEAIHKAIKDSFLMFLPGGHSLMFDEMGEVNLVIFRFLEDF